MRMTQVVLDTIRHRYRARIKAVIEAQRIRAKPLEYAREVNTYYNLLVVATDYLQEHPEHEAQFDEVDLEILAEGIARDGETNDVHCEASRISPDGASAKSGQWNGGRWPSGRATVH